MIPIKCPGCGAKLKAPDNAAGRQMPCPKCGTALTVAEPVFEAEALPDPPPPADMYGLDDPAPRAVESAPPDEGRRPCPMCGEMILAAAAKCRYCGEVFDPALKKAEALKRKGSGAPGDEDLSSGEWVLAILCSGIGCIMGIVWMIQGKPKGKKMFGVSLLAGIAWSVLRAVIEQAANQPR